jgi:L-fucose isomerase-like protein
VVFLMRIPRLGFMTSISPIEAEADKAEERMRAAVINLGQHSLDLFCADTVVASQADALRAARKLREDNVDALLIMPANWTSDAVLLSAINELSVPVLLWAIPYPATYSIAIVQHTASLLKELGIKYAYAYGEPSDRDVGKQVARFAKIASAASMLRSARIGLVGPRPNWRITGPTDTTYDEIDIRRKFGCEIVHVEMGALKSEADEVSDEEASKTIQSMMKEGKVGQVEVKDIVLLRVAKNYVAIKKMMSKLSLNAVAIECYPDNLGLTCLPASWCAEEGIVVGCEGDVGSVIVAMILQELGGRPAATIEPFTVDESENRILLGHPCGSGPVSLAESASKVHFRPFKPDEGVFVQFPIKSGVVTSVNISGRRGNYKMFIAVGNSSEMGPDEWSRIGGLAASIQFNENVRSVLYRVIQEQGIDHHWVTTFGNLQSELAELCSLLDIRAILV